MYIRAVVDCHTASLIKHRNIKIEMDDPEMIIAIYNFLSICNRSTHTEPVARAKKIDQKNIVTH